MTYNNNKFLFFKTKQGFETARRLYSIPPTSIVFIKDDGEGGLPLIWTHNTWFSLNIGLEKSKGLFESFLELKNAVPNPLVGDWAIICGTWSFGDKFPVIMIEDNGQSVISNDMWIICSCKTEGTWSITERSYDHERIELSQYWKKDELIPENYVRKDELDLSDYVKKSELNLSQYITGDTIQNYLPDYTQFVIYSDITNFATKEELAQVLAGQIDLSEYAKIADIQNANYVTAQLLLEAISNIQPGQTTPGNLNYIITSPSQYDENNYQPNTIYFILNQENTWEFGDAFPISLT